ncbi:MAG: KAP family NTPase [Alphaproteobacteria bacterium]|nr:KAP family NTPase [Alphaproteobacteria bacterium]
MLIPDHETEVDFLNCEAIAQTVATVLRENRNRPLTIGIHGDWGAGKSSVLKMIETDLTQDKNVAVLWFNGWTFEGFDDAKTILIESTITELCRQRSATGKVKAIAGKLLRRIDWLKVAKRGGGVALNVLTGLPAPDQIQSALAMLNGVTQRIGDMTSEDVTSRLNEIGGFLKPAENGDNLPETIHAFREEFKTLLDEAKIDQLVVLIDDLDRCLPNTAVETLEAIRLFLFVPKTAFIIGADEAMIEYAVRQHFPDLPAASGPLPYARNYLEKLVQIPFRIPALGAQETRAYVMLLLLQGLVGEDHEGFKTLLNQVREGLRQPWLGESATQSDVQAVDKTRRTELDAAFVLAQQIAPMLAEGTKGNPRQVKRFLNALLVRQAIAKARGFGNLIRQPVLAKLMLAERFQPDFYEHVAAQAMASGDGKSADLVALEAANTEQDKKAEKKRTGRKTDDSADEVQASGAEKWRDRDWLKRWLTITPAIAQEDLRPYVFVARDKRLLTGGTVVGGLDALTAKLCATNPFELRPAEPEVRSLTPGDAGIVFAAVRERVLAAGSLKTAPPGISGLSLLAKHHPRYQAELVKLLGSFDPSELGPWAVKGWNESITEPNAKQELQGVIQGWTVGNDNDLLKQAAATALSTLKQGSG